MSSSYVTAVRPNLFHFAKRPTRIDVANTDTDKLFILYDPNHSTAASVAADAERIAHSRTRFAVYAAPWSDEDAVRALQPAERAPMWVRVMHRDKNVLTLPTWDPARVERAVDIATKLFILPTITSKQQLHELCAKHDKILVEMFQTWCTHCQETALHTDDILTTANAKGYAVYAINAGAADKSLLDLYDFEGVPAMVVYERSPDAPTKTAVGATKIFELLGSL